MADEERTGWSAIDKQAAFVVVVMGALLLAALVAASVFTGRWQWLAEGALAMLLAAALMAVTYGLFKLSERLFRGSR